MCLHIFKAVFALWMLRTVDVKRIKTVYIDFANSLVCQRFMKVSNFGPCWKMILSHNDDRCKEIGG